MLSLIYFILIVILLLLAILVLPLLPMALCLKLWYEIRGKNMNKLANEFGLAYESNQPSFKRCLYLGIFPFNIIAIKEDWKTNFINGTFGAHTIFICDNLYTTALGGRRTEVLIDGQELAGKELKNNFLKLQDGALTSIWEIKRILKKYN